jgi:hypothetical protein
MSAPANTADPQPNKTNVNVPINSAICLFMVVPRFDYYLGTVALCSQLKTGKNLGQSTCMETGVIIPLGA